MLQGYRTYLAAAIVASLGVLAQTDWVSFLSDPQAGWVAIASSLLFAVLRSITSTPPGVAAVTDE